MNSIDWEHEQDFIFREYRFSYYERWKPFSLLFLRLAALQLLPPGKYNKYETKPILYEPLPLLTDMQIQRDYDYLSEWVHHFKFKQNAISLVTMGFKRQA